MPKSRRWGGTVARSCPSKQIRPVASGSRPAIARNSVDFPHPDGPRMAVTGLGPDPAETLQRNVTDDPMAVVVDAHAGALQRHSSDPASGRTASTIPDGDGGRDDQHH